MQIRKLDSSIVNHKEIYIKQDRSQNKKPTKPAMSLNSNLLKILLQRKSCSPKVHEVPDYPKCFTKNFLRGVKVEPCLNASFDPGISNTLVPLSNTKEKPFFNLGEQLMVTLPLQGESPKPKPKDPYWGRKYLRVRIPKLEKLVDMRRRKVKTRFTNYTAQGELPLIDIRQSHKQPRVQKKKGSIEVPLNRQQKCEENTIHRKIVINLRMNMSYEDPIFY